MYKVQIYQEGKPLPESITWHNQKDAKIFKQSLDFLFETQHLKDFVCHIEDIDHTPT